MNGLQNFNEIFRKGVTFNNIEACFALFLESKFLENPQGGVGGGGKGDELTHLALLGLEDHT